MQILTTIPEIKAYRAALCGSMGFVPTMGALHAGHISLIAAAKAQCDHVIASIFVNPLQFGVNEDLSRYPRPFERDVALLQEAGVAALFAPTVDVLYPQGFATHIHLTNGMDTILCGAHRAGHFAGVCTVVTLLFSLTRPTHAFFGEKDFQQLTILRQLNRDLHLVEHIIGVPTMREDNGLALSSRNQYLTSEQRAIAPALYAILCQIRDTLNADNAHTLLAWGKSELLARGFSRVDYLEMRDAETLQESTIKNNARLFVAATLGSTRLIDNLALND
jgi:pantoate--beta-alanine ligase